MIKMVRITLNIWLALFSLGQPQDYPIDEMFALGRPKDPMTAESAISRHDTLCWQEIASAPCRAFGGALSGPRPNPPRGEGVRPLNNLPCRTKVLNFFVCSGKSSGSIF